MMRRSRPPRLAAWTLAMVVTAALTGCAVGEGSDKKSDMGEPPLGAPLTVTDPRTFALPLDPYQVNAITLPLSTKAERILTQRCLRRFGIGYILPPASNKPTLGRRYGMWDLDSAKVRGYHVQPDPPTDANALPPADVESVLAGRGESSYAGQRVPEGGCFGEARNLLAKGLPQSDNEMLGYQLALDSFNRMSEDSRVRAGYVTWSACMKQAGFEYDEPRKALNDPEFEAAKPTSREISVAVADVTCKQKTGLINVMATVETAYQKRAIDKNAEALRTIRQYLEGRERNAAEILAAT